jgi:hypothetical protein
MAFGNAVGEGFVNGIITKLTVANLGPGDGVFVYSTSTVLPNDLELSYTGSAGTDSAGNEFFAGLTEYALAGGTYYAININDATISIYSAAAEAGPWTLQGALLASTSAAGTLLLEFANGLATNFGFSVNGSGNGAFNGTLAVNGSSLTVGNGSTADLILDPPMGRPGQYPVSTLTVTTPGGANAAWYADVASQLNDIINMGNQIFAEQEGRGMFS